MTDQQNHLSQVLQQQNELVEEIKELNSKIDSKRQMAIKLQGVLEYLDQIGVKLPEPETEGETPVEIPEEATTVPTEVVAD
jgi:hypothetical protein|tara:strand:- start:1647 stop:1889 length:243 start_codon:yes stop_codon:yes gene_type:complete